MKTLAFCTAFADRDIFWSGRYRRWLNAMRQNGLRHDLLLMIDDGSPSLPTWTDVAVIEQLADYPNTNAAIFHFRQRLGRQGMFNYPGWFRSFALAGLYAEAHGFERIVHVESDAFLVSRGAVDWANAVVSGWEAPFCPRIRAPESAIQVMAGDGFAAYLKVCKTPYSHWAGIAAEHWLPFTRVATELIGDRYGATNAPIPPDADWATQTHVHYKSDQLWWLGEECHGVNAGRIDVDRDSSRLIRNLDPSIFTVQTATAQGDKVTLLRLQNLVAARVPYQYLEVGSHLGGTLLPHLLNPDCGRVVSIDKRPDWQPDERARRFSYKGVTTQTMLEALRLHVSENCMAKLRTFDADAADIALCDLGRADLAFIDGEHTVTACFSDFVSIREALAPDAIVAFHDSNLVTDAILNIERDLSARAVQHRLFFLPAHIAVIALGESVGRAADVLGAVEKERDTYVRQSRIGRWEQVARSVAEGEHTRF